MTEFVRGYVLPDFDRPKAEDLLSLLLIWDEVEVEDWDGEAPPGQESEIYRKLKAANLVREYPPFINVELAVDPDLSNHESSAELMQRAEDNGAAFADGLITCVNKARQEAAERGSAPLAITSLAEMASALPPPESSAPITEASMIQVAAKGIRVSKDTTANDVLRFRAKNRQLMGRFRGAMTDLAAAADADTPAKALQQAQAVLTNRVEPELGDLITALDRGRINFAVETLVGATAVSLAPLNLATLPVAGSALFARALKYAFDRNQLVNEHPLGLIYRVRQRFGEPPVQTPAIVTDPEGFIRDLCIDKMVQFHKTLRSDTP